MVDEIPVVGIGLVKDGAIKDEHTDLATNIGWDFEPEGVAGGFELMEQSGVGIVGRVGGVGLCALDFSRGCLQWRGDEEIDKLGDVNFGLAHGCDFSRSTGLP